MAIKPIAEVPRDEIVGKFFCPPTLMEEEEFGWPMQVISVTKAQIKGLRLARGKWDSAKREWTILPRMTATDGAQAINISKVALVCDTAEEAIALHRASVAAAHAIQQFRSSTLLQVRQSALRGKLP